MWTIDSARRDYKKKSLKRKIKKQIKDCCCCMFISTDDMSNLYCNVKDKYIYSSYFSAKRCKYYTINKGE